jgi:predicted ATPase
MREGLALWNEMHYRLFAPLTVTLLAEREAEAGRVEVGLATLNAQLAAIEQTGQHWFDAEVHRVRGELLLKLQRPDVAAAESALMRSIEIARGQQTRTFELRAALSLAKLYKMTGRIRSPANCSFRPSLASTRGPRFRRSKKRSGSSRCVSRTAAAVADEPC